MKESRRLFLGGPCRPIFAKVEVAWVVGAQAARYGPASFSTDLAGYFVVASRSPHTPSK
jgi:hypothetical protein